MVITVKRKIKFYRTKCRQLADLQRFICSRYRYDRRKKRNHHSCEVTLLNRFESMIFVKRSPKYGTEYSNTSSNISNSSKDSGCKIEICQIINFKLCHAFFSLAALFIVVVVVTRPKAFSLSERFMEK